ncbi:MAG: glycosyltransferase family 2 protein [Polaribacter sp.]|nr:glycosyltransferase family 2 protein [Polaribacter sp.]
MRIGINPEKENKEIKDKIYHRVVVPVYIPDFEGYFAGSFEVFKLCLESLLLTVHSQTRITIYNNNCHKDVKTYIDKKYYESEYIDQVFHSKKNVGKINAILASVKGNLEKLITVSDADVFFKNGWQFGVEKLFVNFPEAGMISPVPSSKSMLSYTSNNWFYSLFKGNLSFEKVLDPKAMHRFDLSLGNKQRLYKSIHLKKYLVLTNKKNNSQAVMGCGHFVATVHRVVFDKGSSEPAFFKISNGIESKFIDIPNEKLGFLRLATKENLAFHMGNFTEPWMFEEFRTLKKEISNGIDSSNLVSKSFNKKATFIGKIYLRLLKIKAFRNLLFRRFGIKDYPI